MKPILGAQPSHRTGRNYLTNSTIDTGATTPNRGFTVKSFLVPLLMRPRIAKIIKYTVYFSLIVNFGFYFNDDYLAFHAALPENAPLADIMQQFTTSIDMAAWIGLVFLFELETYALSDEAFEGWVTKALHAGRLVCYISIAYAAYGYTAESLENFDVSSVDEITDICQLADQGTSLQMDVIAYVEITSDNCAELSNDSEFYRISDEVSIIDASTLPHVQWMGWIDIDNAYVWIIVVLLIELEVWLQATDRFASRALRVVRQTKSIFYLVLIGNGVVWALTGYVLYVWDAFLWIFGFWAIELNLAEWEQDRVRELGAAQTASG
jgi:hypothetical protein